jgi:hypothetical protein
VAKTLIANPEGGGASSGDSAVLGRRQADVEVGVHRLGDLLAEHSAQCASGDAAHHLADQVVLGNSLLAAGRPGIPDRSWCGQQRDRVLPVD